MLKVVVDIDDVLWGLNERVTKKLGIEIERITDYNINKCNLLSEEERYRLIREYGEENNFKEIEWYAGVDLLVGLVDNGVELEFNSVSITENIARLKEKQLKEVLRSNGYVNIDSIKFVHNIGGIKKIDSDVDIFIDDSIYNIENSNAKVNICMKKNWNKRYIGSMGERVIWLNNLREVVEYIESLL